MIDIDKLMKEKLEKVKKGHQSCRDCICNGCPYQIEGKYCTADALDDDMYEVIEYLEEKVEDQQERIDIMAADAPIYCKDCRHYDEFTQSCNDGIDGIVTPEFYCANAEPKEDDEDADTSDQA